MKKHLIAAAVAGAFVAPAFAQNVTVYGTLDVSIQQVDVSTAGSSVTKQNGDDPMGTSVIGLKGSEDLGGGMKASFDLQGELNADDGTGTGTSSSFVFQRQSWLAVSGNFGQIKLGRTGTLVDQNYSAAAGGFNYFLSSSSARQGSGKLAGITEYTSPELVKGVKVQLQNINASTTTAGNSGNGYAVLYSAGPWNAGYAVTNINGSSATDIENSVMRVSYDAGFATLTVSRLSNKEVNPSTTDTSSTDFGATIPLGNGLTAVLNYQSFKDDKSTTTDFTQYGAALRKDLSKRTSVYVAAKSQNIDGAASTDTDSFAIGIQHSF